MLRPVRLERTYGIPAGRVGTGIALAVPSRHHPDEAFVVADPPREPWLGQLRWHRVDLATGAVLEAHDLGPQAQYAVDISTDGTLVAFQRYGALRLRTSAGRLCWTSRGWASAAFAESGPRLLAVSAEGHFADLDTGTGHELWRIKGHLPVLDRSRRLVAYLPDRDHLTLRDLAGGHDAARWANPPRPCAVLTGGDVLGLHDTTTIVRLTPGTRRPLWSAEVAGAVMPYQRIGVDEEHGSVVIPTMNGLHELALADGASVRFHSMEGMHRRLSADGRRAVRWNGPAFGDWSRSGGARRTGSGPDQPDGAAARSPDGTLLAAGGYGAVHLWDAATGRERPTIRGRWVGRDSMLRFSADGTLLLSARQAWRATDGAPAEMPFPLSGAEESWTASADGRLLWTLTRRAGYTDSDGTLTRAADGAVLWRTAPHDSAEAGTVFDGDTVVTLQHTFTYGAGRSPSVLRLCDGTVTTVPLRLPEGFFFLEEVVVSADGRFVAVRWGDRLAVLDATTGALLAVLEVARCRPAFSGSRWLFAVLPDGRIAAHDLPGLTVRSHAEPPSQDTFAGLTAPDAASLLAVTSRGLLLRYDPPP